MKNFCYQGSEHDCGFASLKMLFAMISKNKNYLYMPKTSHSEGYTLFDLIEIAAEHNVHLAGYELEVNKISEQQFPMLVEFIGNHMVVVTKVKKGYFFVNDPDRGKLKIRYDEFVRLYAGHALLVENENLDRDYNAKRHRLLPKIYPVVHIVVAALVVSVLGLDFYLMNLSENAPFIFALFMFLIIVEIFQNWYLLKANNEFDEMYLPRYFKRSKYHNSEEYGKYITFKTSIFSYSKSIVVFGSLSVVLDVLLAMNDLRNLLVIAIIAVYKVIEKYLTQFKDDATVRELSIEEAHAFDEKDTVVACLTYLNKKANAHALNLTYRNSIFQFLLILLTLLMMVISNNMSANFAVFHFGIYFVISQGISLVIERLTNNQKYQKTLAQFYDRCDL